MKLDFLKSLAELQPCGLRPIIDVLSDSYPVMAFSEWKELAINLIDDGFVSKMVNGQHKLTPAGQEAIEKGTAFIESEPEPEPEPEQIHDEPRAPEPSKALKPADGHPWKEPFSPNGPKALTKQPAKEPHPEVSKPEFNEVEQLDTKAESLAKSMAKHVAELTTDELLAECRLSKSIIDNLVARRKQAITEVSRRLGSGFFLEVRYHGEQHGCITEGKADVA
ncbi:hypothetical protein [Aliidiomarina maris]|uniref:Uncharacterized protein n=1 Tax=Aliidiomarina maris TaxID=531312 RepID=A0A327X3F7_9GAMM|nr:hypothetical protein [Aliidiomarina maris]RAK01650.1 hypothetical protein B0I24_101273 [Aliidiomarina maris]RUO28474.1 hypothetical protein CWE07_01305 [Aliidiomarina maris]